MQHEWGLEPMIGVGSLFGLAWVLVTLTTVRVLQSGGSLFSRRVGLVISVALAVTLFAGALGVVRYNLTNQALRIAVWTYLGAFSVTLAVVLNTLALDFIQPGFTLALYMVTTAAAGGSVLGFVIGLYDAHQRRNQLNLAHKQTEAESLSNRVNVLNRVLRHDIRTQAQLLQGYTERMETGNLSPETATERIQQTIDRLTTLSDEARQLQTILDENEFETETVDVVTAVEEAADTVQSAHGNLTVEYDLPAEQLVEASPMLTQALEHVLHNVAEHTDRSEPRAEISLTSAPSAARTVELTIADNGPGIDDIEMVHNAGEGESQLRHSKGFGLWLVTWIVEEGRGELRIEPSASEDGGTIVTITLPVAV